MSDIYKLCQINISGLRLINKEINGKKENLVETFSKKSARNISSDKLC